MANLSCYSWYECLTFRYLIQLFLQLFKGIVISVKTPLEHKIAIEKGIKEEMKKQLDEKDLYINSIEREVRTLRTILKKNGIVRDIPETKLKIVRKV